MNKFIKTICIFASASNNLDNKYKYPVYELGKLIAQNGYNIVYGGSNRGLMGVVTSAARTNGSSITGIMPKLLKNMGIEEGNCTKFITTEGMRERKAKMDELSDAVIALPGGFGTLEELSEMIVQKQMGYNKKPIVIFDSNGYYDKLIDFFNFMIKERFSTQNSSELYFYAQSPEEVVKYINSYEPTNADYLCKKLDITQTQTV